MKDLCIQEIQFVSGGRLHPSIWVAGSLAGTIFATGCFTLLAFSPNPITLATALSLGAGLGLGYVGLIDIFRELESSRN